MTDQRSKSEPLCKVVDALSADVTAATSSPKAAQHLLARSQCIDIVRTSVPAGEELPDQIAPAESILVCVDGQLRVQLKGESHDVKAGQLMVLPSGVPYSLTGIKTATALLMLPQIGRTADEEVDEASEESFPASDSPAWTGVTRP